MDAVVLLYLSVFLLSVNLYIYMDNACFFERAVSAYFTNTQEQLHVQVGVLTWVHILPRGFLSFLMGPLAIRRSLLCALSVCLDLIVTIPKACAYMHTHIAKYFPSLPSEHLNFRNVPSKNRLSRSAAQSAVPLFGYEIPKSAKVKYKRV